VLIAIPVVLWARTRRASIHQSRSE
jgi:hypothetical protein